MDSAIAEMRAWVKSNFSPLIDFALYDNESPNGYAWPDVELSEELHDEFHGTYPDELIERVASELEEANGPWGREDYGNDD